MSMHLKASLEVQKKDVLEVVQPEAWGDGPTVSQGGVSKGNILRGKLYQSSR